MLTESSTDTGREEVAVAREINTTKRDLEVWPHIPSPVQPAVYVLKPSRSEDLRDMVVRASQSHR